MMKLIVSIVIAMLVPLPALAAPAPRMLVSATPVAGAPDGAKAFRIVYRTKTGRGVGVQATGLVVVPAGAAPRGGRDTVAWTHGTTGIADACAPSANTWRFSIIAGLPQLLQRGYLVVAPDYIGLGSAGVHPFLVGKDTAQAVLDAVRAAREVPGANASGRFALRGESQGGHAALWSAALARSYAPELRLVGIAAAAPATDLVANIAGSENAAVRALMTSYAGVSWSQIYDVPLSTVTGRVGQDLMHRLARQCVTLDGFKLGTKIGLARMTLALRGVDLAKLPRWGALMRENSVRPAVLGVPLLVAQGSADVIIAPTVTRAFVRKTCRAGQPVRFIEVPGGDHVTIAKRTATETIAWLEQRFAGRPAASDCATL
jgi:pimeloyl-ACP methyl ester carboxylesterase